MYPVLSSLHCLAITALEIKKAIEPLFSSLAVPQTMRCESPALLGLYITMCGA